MKIKIESDVFDIVNRIKEIDDGYFAIYDTIKNRIEIHNGKQFNSYCFTSKFENLTASTIDEILYSNIRNIDKIMEDIDKNNQSIEQNSNNQMMDYGAYMFGEIYNYYNNSSKGYDSDVAFSTVWR